MSELKVSKGGRRYGRLPDGSRAVADKLAFRLSVPAVTLPAKASTSQWMGKIRDQGNEGSCTGQMGAEIRDLLYRKLYPFEKDKSVTPDQFMCSASFVYKNNLIADGDLGQDNGSTIHQTIVTLNRYGSCLEAQEPYSDHDYSSAPTEQQYKDALTYKGGAYHYLPDLASVKACIASGYSCGGGIDVYESFEDSDLATTGFMPMPGQYEMLLGGHAQHFMDYDDELKFPDGSKGGVFVQNSWGSSWGISATDRKDRGCYWMPYAYFSAGYVSDIWIIHLGPAW